MNSEREKDKKITDLHRMIRALADEIIYAWSQVDKLEEAIDDKSRKEKDNS